jgi:hypothetical protein
LVCGALAPQPAAHSLLAERDGVGLLQSLLRPEAMLDAGRLSQFYSALKVRDESLHHGLAAACAAY